MEVDIYKKASKVWREISDGKEMAVLSSQLTSAQVNSFFHVGDYYYYILDFTQAKFIFVSEDIERVLGYSSELRVDEFLEKIHPDDQNYILRFENAAKNFVHKLPIHLVKQYKISYDFRILRANGTYVRILHQVVCLNHCEKGRPLHALGVHTDITHIKQEGFPKLSFIGMNGAPSYFDHERNYEESKTGTNYTYREIEIIRLIAKGLKSKEIASQLSIAKSTVDKHRNNICRKSGTTMSQLIFTAIKEGWI